ncbi:MAG: hypothetical protein ABW156_02445 [Jiangellaceae bacterium]
MTEFEPLNWEARLAARMNDHARRQTSRRNERAEFAERRNHGLAARHRNKLARIPNQRQETPVEPTLNPTDIIGAKGWCWNCQEAVVYEVGPEGDWYWQHTHPGTPDNDDLQEITIPADRIRMFQHIPAVTQRGGSVR